MIKDTTAIRGREKSVLSNKMQTLYFASIAHDLRTPLNSVLAFNSALLKMLQSNSTAQKTLKLQRNSCLFLLNLIEDVLDLSKIQFDKFEVQNTWFSLQSVV